MAAGLILEGITGSGKTSTLTALAARPDFQQMLGLQQGQIFTEDVTFGEFMRESRENPYSMARLQAVLAQMEHESNHNPNYLFILERFHFSYNTFAKNWSIYRSIEERPG